MAFSLSKDSLDKLKGVHPKLANVFVVAIKTSPIDFTVLEGIRSAARQQILFKEGKSKCDGIKNKSEHQVKSDGLGHAVDCVPYPINWNDGAAFKKLSDHVKKTARSLGVNIEWGGDWKTFIDKPHYQLKGG